MSPLLIDLGWKSVLLAAAILLAWQALRDRAAGEQVLLLRLGIGALLALPLLALSGPSLELAVLPVEEIADAAPMAVEAISGAALPPVAAGIDWLLALYCAGVAVIVLRLAFGLVTLMRWTRAAVPATEPHWTGALARASRHIVRPVRLLVSSKVDAPMSWGVAPAWILIGPGTEQQSSQADAVLAHEIAHVRRLDWPMLMLAQLATALLWFNPLVWWIGRALAAQIELAADEDALGQVARADYAQTLLCVGAAHAHPSACGMTYARSTLGQRIRGVLEGGPKRPASRTLAMAMLVAVIGFAGPLGALRLVPAEAQPVAEPVAEQMPLPAIVPPAQAQELPQKAEAPKRRPQPRKPRKPSPAVPVAVTATAKIAALPALKKPPKPGQPDKPAPGTDAAHKASLASKDAWAVNPSAWKKTLPSFDTRKYVSSLTEGAHGLRIKAQDMERVAADPAMPRETRAAYARTAGALHREAQQMERNAKRALEQR